MRILIVGAGTIGLSYGWLLSDRHEVTLLARPGRHDELGGGVELVLNDLRKGSEGRRVQRWAPRLVSDLAQAGSPGHGYDVVLVMVDRRQLASVLEVLGPVQERCPIVLMLNHWDARAEAERFLAPGTFALGFPGQIGGGRHGGVVEATIFRTGTVLGRGPGTDGIRRAMAESGLAVRDRADVDGWLAVHYLQQSVSAGAVLQAGSYEAFVSDREAVRQMVLAFREGIEVCRRRGVKVWRVHPAPLFRLPTRLVASMMQRMLASPEVSTMVTAHMGHGLGEWVTGYREVLADGERRGVPMPHWRSYLPAVDAAGDI